MDTPDRLAAYLAGDLDPADASAVEEELARDPALRAQLAAMRRADGALLALRSPQAPDGFEERLRAALDPVLAEELRTDETEGQAQGTFDELAARRSEHERRRGRWLPAIAGVAAAAAAVVVLGNVVQFGGGDDGGVAGTTADTADDAEIQLFEGESDADMAEEAGPPPPEGPTVVSSDRELDEQDLETLLAAPELEGVTAQGYVGEEGETVADGWSLALGVDPHERADGEDAPLEEESAEESAEATDDEAAEEDTAADEPMLLGAPMQTRGTEPLSPEDEAAVARCLDYLTEHADAPSAIPAYVELATYDGEDVLVFGLVTEDPATGAFTRTELWVVGRDDCEPRYFRQE